MKHISPAISSAAALSPNSGLDRSYDSPAEPNYLQIALTRLEPALALLQPQHKALFLTILHEVDVKRALATDGRVTHRASPLSLIDVGAEAVKSISRYQCSFTEERFSVMVLACLLYEFGCLYPYHPRGAGAPHLCRAQIEALEIERERSVTHYAHPFTWALVGPYIEPLKTTDSELVRYLHALLGKTPYRSARMGSEWGPFGHHPVEPWQAHMRERVIDCYSTLWSKAGERRKGHRASVTQQEHTKGVQTSADLIALGSTANQACVPAWAEALKFERNLDMTMLPAFNLDFFFNPTRTDGYIDIDR